MFVYLYLLSCRSNAMHSGSGERNYSAFCWSAHIGAEELGDELMMLCLVRLLLSNV